MDDMSELLSGILNSPEGMENLKKAASALLKGSSEKEQKNQPSYGGGSDSAVQSLLRSLEGKNGSRGGEFNGGSFDGGGSFGNLGIFGNRSDDSQNDFSDGDETGLSPAQLAGMVKMVSALNSRKEDDRTRLLLALRPHLSPEKRDRIDKAVKFLKIMDVLPLIRGAGIL